MVSSPAATSVLSRNNRRILATVTPGFTVALISHFQSLTRDRSNRSRFCRAVRVEHRRSASNSVRQSESCFLADQLPRFIPSLNTRMYFIVLGKGSFFLDEERSSALTRHHSTRRRRAARYCRPIGNAQLSQHCSPVIIDFLPRQIVIPFYGPSMPAHS